MKGEENCAGWKRGGERGQVRVADGCFPGDRALRSRSLSWLLPERYGSCLRHCDGGGICGGLSWSIGKPFPAYLTGFEWRFPWIASFYSSGGPKQPGQLSLISTSKSPMIAGTQQKNSSWQYPLFNIYYVYNSIENRRVMIWALFRLDLKES